MIVSFFLIGEFQFRKFDDFILKIKCWQNAERVVISYLEELGNFMTVFFPDNLW